MCNHKRIFPEIAHVLSEMKLEEVCHLCVHSLWGFLEVVRQFVVNFLIGEPFFAYVNFMALSFVSLLYYVFMYVVGSLLCMLGWCLREV